MPDSPLSSTTIEHDRIRRWAEARGGRPATVKGTEDEEHDADVLRIAFREDPALEPIGWEEFFEMFEGAGLAFLYQEHARDGKISRFFKLVEREEADDDEDDRED